MRCPNGAVDAVENERLAAVCMERQIALLRASKEEVDA